MSEQQSFDLSAGPVALPPSTAATSLIIADYVATLHPASPCPRCGGARGRDVRWGHTIHIATVTQLCPDLIR